MSALVLGLVSALVLGLVSALVLGFFAVLFFGAPRARHAQGELLQASDFVRPDQDLRGEIVGLFALLAFVVEGPLDELDLESRGRVAGLAAEELCLEVRSQDGPAARQARERVQVALLGE